jgi:hypothetical protein
MTSPLKLISSEVSEESAKGLLSPLNSNGAPLTVAPNDGLTNISTSLGMLDMKGIVALMSVTA